MAIRAEIVWRLNPDSVHNHRENSWGLRAIVQGAFGYKVQK
jgi:hypothetical protein